MCVQSVSVSQKVDAGGYTGNATTGLVPTQTLLAAFDFIDSEVRPTRRRLRRRLVKGCLTPFTCEAARVLAA